jgi:hypothetical protein
MGILTINVNNRPIDQFKHTNGGTYVEGRKGKPYTIKYKNTTNKRQKIIVSVDGLNVMTGDSTWNRGYVVDAYGSIEIPGWRKDSDNVAAFEFASVRNSYNNLNDNGDTANVGVIGCKVFDEKVRPEPQKETHHYHHYDHYWHRPIWDNWNYWNGYPYGYPKYTLTGGGCSGGTMMSSGVNSVNMAQQNVNFVGASLHNGGEVFAAMDSIQELQPQNSLGTGWGKNTEFKTQSVTADWEQYPSESHIIYYDDKRGLEKRGVRLEPVREYRIPQAFPDGCPPPKQR